MWRLLTHKYLTLGRYELESKWCLADACEAHDALDVIDAKLKELHDG